MASILDKVVGFSSKDCDCIDTGRPADYNTSYSGYYLDGSEHGIPLKVPTVDCGHSTIWDTLTEARTEAINDFILHYGNKLAENRNRVLNNKAVSVGRKSYARLNTVKAYSGIRIAPKVYKGLVLVISKFQRYTLEENTTVKIVDEDGTQVYSYTVTPENAFSSVTSDVIRLPLSKNGRPLCYTIYASGDDEVIIDNTLGCGTCKTKKTNWQDIFDVGGIQTDIEAEMYTNDATQNYSFGFLIDGHIECDGTDWLLKMDSGYFASNPYGKTIGKILQLLWAVKTISKVLASDNINFYTTLSREALYGKRNHLNKLATDLLLMVANDVPDDLSHCFPCRSSFGFSKQSL